MRSNPSTPVGFAHRGGMAHAPENTLEAFRTAIRMGATGLESDGWVTTDGAVALSHAGFVRRGLAVRRIASRSRHDLPPSVPTLDALYGDLGSDFELSLDVKVAAAGPAAIDAAVEHGGDAIDRLWLCHADLRRLRTWRLSSDRVRLVNSTRRRFIREGAAKRARRLAALEVDALNLPARDWTPDLVETFRAVGVLAFGWGVQEPGEIEALLAMGVDGVYSDHVDRMLAAIASAGRPG